MTFKLDTSGFVFGGADECSAPINYQWPDLSPFVQGYVEAMFASLEQQDGQSILRRKATGKIGSGLAKFVGFSDLAPETLARIMEDCADRQRSDPYNKNVVQGAGFWRNRQSGQLMGFPPLTPYLGDDGKVYLK